jgi:hypothetical protein
MLISGRETDPVTGLLHFRLARNTGVMRPAYSRILKL